MCEMECIRKLGARGSRFFFGVGFFFFLSFRLVGWLVGWLVLWLGVFFVAFAWFYLFIFFSGRKKKDPLLFLLMKR